MYLQCKYSLPNARPTALASVFPCSERLGSRGPPGAMAAEFGQPRCAWKYCRDEPGYAQVEIEAFPVQATAAPKDFDCTEILGSESSETRYQPHR